MIETGLMIKALLKQKGMTQIMLAEKVGVSAGAVNQWVAGRNRIDHDHLPKVADALGIEVKELLPNGSSDKFATSSTRFIQSSTVTLPYLPSRGDDQFIDCIPTNGDTYPVHEKWINTNSQYVVIEVEGPAMEPQLREGATVLAEAVSLDTLPSKLAGIYAIRYGGQLVVRRVKTNDLRAGSLSLHSDNEDYGSIIVPAPEIECAWRIISILYQPVR